jgi:DNA-binding NarL/FixJ family response regulator
MIRILLVDDQDLVRTGLRTLAERDGDITVVGEAAEGRTGVQQAHALRPDVVLMDLRMPRMDGIEATAQILADPDLPDTRVLVLTTFDEDEHVYAAIRAGASGYLLKYVSPADLRSAIRTVATGDALLSPAVTATVMRAAAASASAPGAGGPHRPSPPPELSEREIEVLTLVGRGLTNQEIAAELFLSPATTRTYVSRLLAKLGARDRAALIVLAFRWHLVSPDQA